MKLTYRPEIDGLRAIAVLSVIFYHAEFSINGYNLFKGGFFGVDIFFVISGYLITSLILKELIKTNKFSFKIFFERRARRILPPLFLIILVSTIVAWFSLLPESMVNFSESALSSIFFNSNHYFWITGQKYGEETGLLVPLLHTWSLSIEEQFYIFFPIILLFIFRFNKKNIILFIFIMIISSFCAAIFAAGKFPMFNFYILPTRGWELLVGSLIATIKLLKIEKQKYNSKIFIKYLPSLGLLLIIYSIFFIDNPTFHPSAYTLVPIIGSCLIIFFTKENEMIHKLLSNKLFVSIGLISYSLYLWHYPIFSFFEINTNFVKNDFTKIVLIMITFLLSYLTYSFVEKKFRNFKLNSNYFFIIILSFLVFLVVLNFSTVKKKGFEKRLNLSILQKEFIFNKKNYTNYSINDIFNHKFNEDKIKIIVVGNSHGKDFYDILVSNKEIKKKLEIKYLNFSPECLQKFLEENSNNCIRTLAFNKKKFFNMQIKNFLMADKVILSTRWSEADINSLDYLNKYFKKNDIDLTVVSTAPEFDFQDKISNDLGLKGINKQLFNNITFLDRYVLLKNEIPNKKNEKFFKKLYFKKIKKNQLNTNNKLKSQINKMGINYIDLFSIFCDSRNKTCEVLAKDNKKIHTDSSGHISDSGSNFFGKKIYKKNVYNNF